MESYLSSFEVTACPLTIAKPIDDPDNTRSGARYGSYDYYPGRTDPNFGLSDGEALPDTLAFPGNVPFTPSQLPMIQDVTQEHSDRFVFNHGDGTTPGNPSNGLLTGDNRSDAHGASIGFFDSHVSYVGGRDLEAIGDAHNSVSGGLPDTLSVMP